jgi:hypothetical protein
MRIMHESSPDPGEHAVCAIESRKIQETPEQGLQQKNLKYPLLTTSSNLLELTCLEQVLTHRRPEAWNA